MNTKKPLPSVMPLDRVKWRDEVNISQFINTYYQYKDVNNCLGASGNVLIIGPGAGLDAVVLRWKGYTIKTLDIDETFSPDVIGSCHDMSMFNTHQFDAVIASHVLEHLPLCYLDQALKEISRISKYAIIYLPVAGRHAQVSLVPKMFGGGFVLDFFKFWEEPSGTELKYRYGQHYWEIGYRGFRLKDVMNRFGKYFDIISHYRNKDWIPSYNFVLKSTNN